MQNENKKNGKTTVGKLSIWQNKKMHAKLWKSTLNKIKQYEFRLCKLQYAIVKLQQMYNFTRLIIYQ